MWNRTDRITDTEEIKRRLEMMQQVMPRPYIMLWHRPTNTQHEGIKLKRLEPAGEDLNIVVDYLGLEKSFKLSDIKALEVGY